jgi:DNA end-binding protein Ku
MDKSGKVALARVKIRTRTRLALLRPRDGRFSLDMIRFGDELVPAKEVDVPESRAAKGAGKELDLALDLIDRMTGKFEPAKHPDDYRKAVLKAVEQKEAAGEELAEDVEAEEKKGAKHGKVIDLADMLSRSLSGTKKRRPITKRAPAHAARTAHAKKSSKPRAAKKTAATKRKAARR